MTHPIVRALVRTTMSDRPVHVFRAPEDPLEPDERLCSIPPPTVPARIVYHVAPVKDRGQLGCTACGHSTSETIDNEESGTTDPSGA